MANLTDKARKIIADIISQTKEANIISSASQLLESPRYEKWKTPNYLEKINLAQNLLGDEDVKNYIEERLEIEFGGGINLKVGEEQPFSDIQNVLFYKDLIVVIVNYQNQTTFPFLKSAIGIFDIEDKLIYSFKSVENLNSDEILLNNFKFSKITKDGFLVGLTVISEKDNETSSEINFIKFSNFLDNINEYINNIEKVFIRVNFKISDEITKDLENKNLEIKLGNNLFKNYDKIGFNQDVVDNFAYSFILWKSGTLANENKIRFIKFEINEVLIETIRDINFVHNEDVDITIGDLSHKGKIFESISQLGIMTGTKNISKIEKNIGSIAFSVEKSGSELLDVPFNKIIKLFQKHENNYPYYSGLGLNPDFELNPSATKFEFDIDDQNITRNTMNSSTFLRSSDLKNLVDKNIKPLIDGGDTDLKYNIKIKLVSQYGSIELNLDQGTLFKIYNGVAFKIIENLVIISYVEYGFYMNFRIYVEYVLVEVLNNDETTLNSINIIDDNTKYDLRKMVLADGEWIFFNKPNYLNYRKNIFILEMPYYTNNFKFNMQIINKDILSDGLENQKGHYQLVFNQLKIHQEYDLSIILNISGKNLQRIVKNNSTSQITIDQKESENNIKYSVRQSENNSYKGTEPIFFSPNKFFIPIQDKKSKQYNIYEYNSNSNRLIKETERQINYISEKNYTDVGGDSLEIPLLSPIEIFHISKLVGGSYYFIDSSDYSLDLSRNFAIIKNISKNDDIIIYYNSKMGIPKKLLLQNSTFGDDIFINKISNKNELPIITPSIIGAGDDSFENNQTQIYGFNLYKNENNLDYNIISENSVNETNFKVKYIRGYRQKNLIWILGFNEDFSIYHKWVQIYSESTHPYTFLEYSDKLKSLILERLNSNVDGEIKKSKFDNKFLDISNSGNTTIATTTAYGADLNEFNNKVFIFGKTNKIIFEDDKTFLKDRGNEKDINFNISTKYIDKSGDIDIIRQNASNGVAKLFKGTSFNDRKQFMIGKIELINSNNSVIKTISQNLDEFIELDIDNYCFYIKMYLKKVDNHVLSKIKIYNLNNEIIIEDNITIECDNNEIFYNKKIVIENI